MCWMLLFVKWREEFSCLYSQQPWRRSFSPNPTRHRHWRPPGRGRVWGFPGRLAETVLSQIPGELQARSRCRVLVGGGFLSSPSPFCFRALTLLWSEHVNSPSHASFVLLLLRLFQDSADPSLLKIPNLRWHEAHLRFLVSFSFYTFD